MSLNRELRRGCRFCFCHSGIPGLICEANAVQARDTGAMYSYLLSLPEQKRNCQVCLKAPEGIVWGYSGSIAGARPALCSLAVDLRKSAEVVS